jgi:undecaprenyl phosphate N,N'-diacetylbacillosamine 1-phosphate transferase
MTRSTRSIIGPYPGKDAFDRLAAGTVCVALASLAAAIAFASWIEDGGPPLTLANRIGRHRRPFTEIKFRSTRYEHPTRVGQVLRRTGLEQLPQLLNVLRGEMSLVGPQPLAAQESQGRTWRSAELDWRFAAKPGITGLAQLLAARGARNSQRLDRLYLSRQSLALDLQLLVLSMASHAVGRHRIRRWLRRLGSPRARAPRTAAPAETA